MKKGSYYKFNFKGYDFIAEYMGREKNYECMLCYKGCNAYCFNAFNTLKEYKNGKYETLSFGKEHLPELTEIDINDYK